MDDIVNVVIEIPFRSRNKYEISNADYESCNITFDDKGNAKVSIVGKGKFEGMAVCNANKNSASISSDCATNANYFSYEDITVVTNVIVEDANKCKSYIQSKFTKLTEEGATTLCTTNQAVRGFTLQDVVLQGQIPSSDYETAGLRIETGDGISITGYNIEGGTDVVIPSQIDGKTVVAIGDKAFTTQGIMPTDISSNHTDYKVSFLSNNLSKKYVVRKIDVDYSTIGLGVTSVVMPNTLTSIGEVAFYGNKLTNVTIPSSVAKIGNYAFENNQITSITFPDTLVILGCRVFVDNPIMEDSSYSFPSNVTEVCKHN